MKGNPMRVQCFEHVGKPWPEPVVSGPPIPGVSPRHWPTCPYDNRIAAKDNKIAECNCREDYYPPVPNGETR